MATLIPNPPICPRMAQKAIFRTKTFLLTKRVEEAAVEFGKAQEKLDKAKKELKDLIDEIIESEQKKEL